MFFYLLLPLIKAMHQLVGAKESYSQNFQLACAEIIRCIEARAISTGNIESEKIRIAMEYGLPRIPKNAEIFNYAEKNSPNFRLVNGVLKIKPVRTLSGVANISVMWLDKNRRDIHDPSKFYSCPATCIYCAQGKNAPKSYTGCEPTTMRAIRNDYDPWKQVTNRIRQLHIIGHSTDKCELIVMGGTFTATTVEYQEEFVKRCFDAFNGSGSEDLTSAQLLNETAPNRCVGITIETRADFCREEHVRQMLRLGCTRVEIGIQSTSDDILRRIRRGHDTKENVHAIKLLKDSGLKFTAHWMPGLTGLLGEINENMEIELFMQLFENPDYRPDELKIYPALVLPDTELYETWKRGEYHPLGKEQMLRLLIKMKQVVPSYVRIKRVMRDISEHETAAGASTTNLRQLAKTDMEKQGINCHCIRCREVGVNYKRAESVDLIINEYEASGGKEFFISYEDTNSNALLGFIRLRISNGSAFVRELHVYGEVTPISETSKQAQHRGLGKKLLAKAEEIASSFGTGKIKVTSGVGVRDYYRKLGYALEKPYMAKRI
jgi:elongator complex protein 3